MTPPPRDVERSFRNTWLAPPSSPLNLALSNEPKSQSQPQDGEGDDDPTNSDRTSSIVALRLRAREHVQLLCKGV
ncbi:hypothetical protein IscW_ISCW008990 [Ixodes scapularis]|uniref:OAR domain-containing protein n=1 Tax=Ixodes scapularis TaxID=6945 RepID=B7Q179_IXOSC|nr:hypothetical protein IscW_ISCW008990 [Ixodes scapularis]|eukprot:XP_002409052.1 hypothetical protein IscW_ISCW008990 [Ixodes scapularis]